jgi:hypothetical protein
MKRMIVLLCFVTILFAVRTVPRTGAKSDEETPARIEVVQSRSDTQDDDTRKDRFQDADSNGVNDQREDDFQRIKLLKTKHKLVEPRTSGDKTKEEAPKQTSKKAVQPTKTPEKKSRQ